MMGASTISNIASGSGNGALNQISAPDGGGMFPRRGNLQRRIGRSALHDFYAPRKACTRGRAQQVAAMLVAAVAGWSVVFGGLAAFGTT